MRKVAFVLLVFCAVLFAARFARSNPTLTSPQIVASVVLTDQTVAIDATPLLTSSTGGLYRLTAYAEFAPQCDNTWYPEFKWIDGTGQTKRGLYGIGSCLTSGQVIARIPLGGTIFYSVQRTNQQNDSYNAYITAEQLQ